MTPFRSERRATFAEPPEVVWAALTDVGAYRRWWPWLTELDGDGFDAGATWRCHVRPPLPYSVRFTLHLEEVEVGTSPIRADSDNDGLTDFEEVRVYGTDPWSPDTDGDSLGDFNEIRFIRTSPILADTDGDGWDDATELASRTDPLDPESHP